MSYIYFQQPHVKVLDMLAYIPCCGEGVTFTHAGLEKGVKVALAVVAMIIAIAVSILLLKEGSMQLSGGSGVSNVERLALSKSIFAFIVLEGEGKVLVNGSEIALVNSTEPFSLEFQAQPRKCWAFKWWLVNGTIYSVVPELQLHVRSNTTVEAVFEKPRYRIAFESNVERSSLTVNESRFMLPVEVEAPACSVLQIKPMPPEGWEWPWGTLLVLVDNNKTEFLNFVKTEVLVTLKGVLVPVNVTITANGNASSTPCTRDSSIRVKLNTTISVEPYGADRKGCVFFNETHLVCLVSWLVNKGDWPSPRIRATVMEDLELEQVVAYVKLAYPIKYTEILAPNGTMVKAPVIPGDRWMIVPFIGEYEYLGNGVLKLKGGRVSVFIEPPEGWRKIRVYANLTTTPSKIADSYIMMVVRNVADILACGRYVLPTGNAYGIGYVVVLFDKEALKAWSAPGYDPFFSPEYNKYVRCEFGLENGIPRSCGQAQGGPSYRLLEGVKEGWLLITSYGTMYVKIEVVEWES